MVGWEDEQGKLHPEEIDKAEYPELPESDSLWDVLDECWNRDPNKRPTMPVVLEKVSEVFFFYSPDANNLCRWNSDSGSLNDVHSLSWR